MTATERHQKRGPLKDQVFVAMHESILSGHYSAGQWLRQEEIAGRLGVSMTPVREALDLLVSSGLAERVPYRGVRVLQLSEPDILDAYETRLLLEAVAAHHAALAITPDHLSGLRRSLEQERDLVSLGDMPEQREASRAFHSEVVAAAANPLLLRIYLEVLRAFPDWMLYEHLYRHPEMLAESIRMEHREHERIVDALAEGDPDAAVQRAVEHVLQRGREIELYLGIPRAALETRERQVKWLIPGAAVNAGHTHKETL